MTRSVSRRRTAALALILGAGIALVPAASVFADTTISGPINLGTATSFGVLGASTVTNTGTTTITGDVGVNPGTAITGFPPGIYGGTLHQTDAIAIQAQNDLTTAYNVAAGLTPVTTGLSDLAGLSLTPGVYSGPTLSLNGDVTLAGSADSVWVFQAASTLITGSASRILLTGGASSCNVFWQVGSSATLGTASTFVGTIMASQSITATTAATIEGRLLASNAAVTLDSNVITRPVGCADASTTVVSTSPTITSQAPTATAVAGTPYSSTITASGTPSATYTVTSGVLPTGLTLNATTGAITGTPTTPGSYTFTVTAANGTAPDVSAVYSITVSAPPAAVRGVAAQAELAATGTDALPLVAAAGGLLAMGLVFLVIRTVTRRRTN
jgi:hypothetical protein